MKKNEAGFTYPFTLMVLLLFLIFFSVRIEGLLIERKTARESLIIRQQEYYFLTSIKKMEGLYQAGTTLPLKDTMTYLNGRMEYQSEKPINNVQKVNFTLSLNSGETIMAHGFFDLNSKRLIKWIEMK